MNLDHDASGTQGTWDHLGWSYQRFLFQAYFWSSALDFCPMQWKSLHNSHFSQYFKNNFLTLDHISKAPTKLLFYIKKESILHKIVKSKFLTTFGLSCAKGRKIISESKLASDISFERESFEGKLEHFSHFLGS